MAEWRTKMQICNSQSNWLEPFWDTGREWKCASKDWDTKKPFQRPDFCVWTSFGHKPNNQWIKWRCKKLTSKCFWGRGWWRGESVCYKSALSVKVTQETSFFYTLQARPDQTTPTMWKWESIGKKMAANLPNVRSKFPLVTLFWASTV